MRRLAEFYARNHPERGLPGELEHYGAVVLIGWLLRQIDMLLAHPVIRSNNRRRSAVWGAHEILCALYADMADEHIESDRE